MLITLFTDSSHNRRLQRSTWACWFKADGVAFRFSGVVKEPCANSAEGELAAIANGLHCIAVSLKCQIGATKVIIQSDSMEALDALKRENHPRALANKIVEHIIGQTLGWELDCRHIKAHQGKTNARRAVNHWCDQEAKRQMGLLIEAVDGAKARPTARDEARAKARTKTPCQGSANVLPFHKANAKAKAAPEPVI